MCLYQVDCSHAWQSNAGSLHPVIVDDEATCEDAGYSVIPTKAECQQAAVMTGLLRTSVTDPFRINPYTAYCGFNHIFGYYTFETTGKKQTSCWSQDFASCLCKKGAYAPNCPFRSQSHRAFSCTASYVFITHIFYFYSEIMYDQYILEQF